MFPELGGLDWAILLIIGLSMLLSLFRGFVKEALSLAAWVLGFVIATSFSGQLALLLEDSIGNAALRHSVSYLILFLAALISCTLLGNLLRQFVRMTGLGVLDRLLGTAFGFARGVLVVVVLAFVAQSMLPVEELAEDAVLLPGVMLLVQWAEQNFSILMTERNLI